MKACILGKCVLENKIKDTPVFLQLFLSLPWDKVGRLVWKQGTERMCRGGENRRPIISLPVLRPVWAAAVTVRSTLTLQVARDSNHSTAWSQLALLREKEAEMLDSSSACN